MSRVCTIALGVAVAARLTAAKGAQYEDVKSVDPGISAPPEGIR